MLKLCKECGKIKKHHAKGMCSSCYMKLVNSTKNCRTTLFHLQLFGIEIKICRVFKDRKKYLQNWFKQNSEYRNEYNRMRHKHNINGTRDKKCEYWKKYHVNKQSNG